ncbi:unnamed protein product [Vitrella brassicaformis CCMP3155]|uniref:Uncharacterized protein n=1 Tax=Vitrella brassicaformis (strain CCMP3155) TaxID=1169540 RepID=A0A0G4H519_VITBC|nr:unnamed protein product [Vitrella brassicaformis CCMP3155]|eukprot:CEM38888.1 unnamed protein product [Vitrella brassicaformis CCMP3155]
MCSHLAAGAFCGGFCSESGLGGECIDSCISDCSAECVARRHRLEEVNAADSSDGQEGHPAAAAVADGEPQLRELQSCVVTCDLGDVDENCIGGPHADADYQGCRGGYHVYSVSCEGPPLGDLIGPAVYLSDSMCCGRC